MTILGDLHRRVHAKNARTREVGRGGVRPLAEGKDVEPVRPGDQRVVLLGDAVDDRVAGAHLVRLPALPREPGAGEDVEDLLLVELDVHGRGAAARVELQASDADLLRPGGVAEVDAVELHRAAAEVARLDVVPVRDAHQASSKWMSCAPSQSTSRPISSRCSRPSTTVAKWLPASWPALLAKHVWPYGKRISVSLTPPG